MLMPASLRISYLDMGRSGGVRNVGCFAQANYFTISLTYYFIPQQCLIWLHQYVSQIYFDQLYESPSR